MSDDFKAHALNTSHDFYELLGLTEAANDAEIRSAYRKATLKYHPDKVGARPETLERWHLLQIAHEVLSDSGVRELYDNARRAREEKKKRDNAFEGRRKWMKEDLERRESGALKRKRDEADAEEVFERELRRIAEDGKRRRKEREEALRKEALDFEEEARKQREGDTVAQDTPVGQRNAGPTDMDRSVTLRFPKNDKTEYIDRQHIISFFERFGPIEDAVLRDKKIKIDGEKHRQPYVTAVLVFKSIVGAHAAVSDISKLQASDRDTWGMFEQVGWAAGQEPDCVPKAPATPVSKVQNRDNILPTSTDLPTTPRANGDSPATIDGGGLKKVPSFASFKGTPSGTPRGPNSPSLDEITMIRLKNAERRRLEEKIRREEAAVDA